MSVVQKLPPEKRPWILLSDVKSGSSLADFDFFSLITADFLWSIDCPKKTIRTFTLFLITGVIITWIRHLVFSVTPLKIDRNKNQNCSIDKIQSLRKEKNIYMQSPSLRFKSKEFFWSKICGKMFRELYGDAILGPIQMGSNMADENRQKHLSMCLAAKEWILSKNSRTLK